MSYQFCFLFSVCDIAINLSHSKASMQNMPLPQSNVEWHAAITHFPITLLFVAVFFDIVALFFKRPALREFSLWMLTLCVISLPFALLTGWLTGREFKRAPVGYDQHWQAAVITSVLALVLLVWRLAAKDKLPRMARIAVLTLTGACAMGVGYTGHQGGEMTFGGRDVAAEAPAPLDPNQQIANAANKMAQAAGKLDQSTERVFVAAVGKKSPPPAPAPAPAPIIQAVPPDAITDAANKLSEVASRFDSIAGKMEKVAQVLEETSKRPAPVATAPPVAVKGGTPAATPVKGPDKSGPDPKLVAAGEKLFFDENVGCTDCHAMNGKGRAKNGDLTHIGSKQGDVDWHIAHLHDPKSKVPGSKMPAYDDKTPDELRALAVFMVSKK